ncbi:MAG: 9-O-acetylesterase [Pedosphaera sp.]|nr:9-O-acetylesterase [Pedosphaera sp.]
MKIYHRHFWLLALTGIFFSHFSNAKADVRMPAIFGDHMVLQEKAKLPVWGWASPGEKITVTFKNQKKTTTTAADGKWRVDLDKVDSSSESGTLTVTGDNTITFTDVLVGDVWVASGQSNMEFGIQTDSRGKEAITNATDSQIRFFFVPWATALQPQTNISTIVPPSPLNGKWVVCSPEVIGANWAWHGFSAIGYYFAKERRRITGRPMGMIATYKGGTPAQAWTSISGLKKDAALDHYVDEHHRRVDNYTNARAIYSKEHADYEIKMKEWNKAKAAGQVMPEKSAPKEPTRPEGGYGAPANLFNGMVSPLIPYAIKGVIWYQGESNGDNMREAEEYPILFTRLIQDWREKWAQGNFPFLFVQLPNFNAPSKTPSEGRWPLVREAQLKALSLPNTGMAVTIDIGDADNIHPPDKLYVGQRLALVARHVAYGEDLVYSGPIYNSMTIDGNKIRINFSNIGGGLRLGTPPPTATGEALATPTELTGFAIAGMNQKFVWAKAILDGSTVVVFSDAIQQPLAVRYDWGQNPSGDLYNMEGLPASPFRTDDWSPEASQQ